MNLGDRVLFEAFLNYLLQVNSLSGHFQEIDSYIYTHFHSGGPFYLVSSFELP